MRPFFKEVCSLECPGIHSNSGLVVVSVVVKTMNDFNPNELSIRMNSGDVALMKGRFRRCTQVSIILLPHERACALWPDFGRPWC